MNGELIEFLDKKFNKIDEKFDKVNEGLERIGTDVNINKTNILVGFKEAKEERSKIKKRIDKTHRAVDGFVMVVTKLQDEFAMMKEDINRVKDVIREKLGVDLS